jgi:hypothetical protein
MWLAIINIIITGGVIFLDYLWEHRPPLKRKKKLKARIAWALLLGVVATGIMLFLKEKVAEEKTEALQSRVGYLTNEVQDLKRQLRDVAFAETNTLAGLNGLTTTLATNEAGLPTEKRLGLLYIEKKQIVQEEEQIQNRHEIPIAGSRMDIQSLRQERDFEIKKYSDMQLAKQKEAAVQEQIEAINGKKKAEEDAEVERQNQLKAEKEISQKRRFIGIRVLPVFDYTINTLFNMLRDCCQQSDEKLFSDFPGTTPTIYKSNLVKDGQIVGGTNSVSIGMTPENPLWDLEVTAVFGPSFGVRSRTDLMNPNRLARMMMLRIENRATNSQSTLTVRPFLQWNGNIDETNSTLTSVAVGLKVPNGLDFNEQVSPTNYIATIQKALRRFIEAQDQFAPLQLKKN